MSVWGYVELYMLGYWYCEQYDYVKGKCKVWVEK